MGKIANFLGKPILWKFHAFTAIAIAFVFWGTRMPGGDIPSLIFGCLLASVLLLIWTAKIIYLIVQLVYYKKSASVLHMNWCGVGVLPLASILAIVVVQAGVPFYVAFHLSSPSLEQVVNEVQSNISEPPNQWVGVFPVRNIHLVPGGVELTFNKDEFPWGSRGL